MSVVTRFAPSPTGYLHIGGARTALFNYLFSKANNGKFLIRIEDTDRVRWNKEAEDAILKGLTWLGISADESPVSQYERRNRHLEVAENMVRSGTAYRCYLTQEEYRQNKKFYETENKGEKYISPWRNSNSQINEPYVIRIKSPNSGTTNIIDIIQGNLTWQNNNLDDFVLVRSNGDPTYMLSVVVDDWDMQISHIIRGDDHLTNAARQTLIFKANNWKIPHFAHIPLMHGSDGVKLSKRHGALGLDYYREQGFPSNAMINYLLSLGWSFPGVEIFSIAEAAKVFKLGKLIKSPSRFDSDKLTYISSSHIKNASTKELRTWFGQLGSTEKEISYYYKKFDIIASKIEVFKKRAKTLKEIISASFFVHCDEKELQKRQQKLKLPVSDVAMVKKYTLQLPNRTWNPDLLDKNLKLFLKNNNINMKDLGIPLRFILTGSENAPGLIDILLLLGETKVKNRLSGYISRKNKVDL